MNIPTGRHPAGLHKDKVIRHLGNFFHAIGMPEPGPDEQSPVVLTRFATPGYFRVMDIPVLHGRIFRPSDGRVVIINQTFARQFFPGIDNPVGREIAFGSRASPDGERPFRVDHPLGAARQR